MKIWLIRISEPLPNNKYNDRLLRMGLIAHSCIEKFKFVVWWASSFDHFRKEWIGEPGIFHIKENYQINILNSFGYKKNSSIRRLIDDWYTAYQFYKKSTYFENPDIIFCSMPTPELAYEAVKFSKKKNIPVILDVRDYAPEILLEKVSKIFRPIAKIILWNKFRKAKYALNQATSVIGLTEDFLKWSYKFSKRFPNKLDRVFPMAYKKNFFSKTDILESEKFWDKNDVLHNEFNICFFGTINNYFDFEPIFSVAEKLKNYPIKFVICGLGSDYKNLKRKSEHFSNIKFIGWVNQIQIKTLMRRSKVGIAPYKEMQCFLQSTPNKFSEYLSEGLPILSSINGVLGSIIDHYKLGYVYKSKDELYNCILELFNDAGLQSEMSFRSDEYFQKNLNADSVYLNLVNFIEELAVLSLTERSKI
jgi:glycosyltransferase involved in cell wall biosynthesis